MKKEHQNALGIVLTAFVASFCCACNAVTPGPSTTRSIEAPVVVTTAMPEETTAAATVKETTTVPETTTEEETILIETTEIDFGNYVYATTGVNVRNAPKSKGTDVLGTLRPGERVKKLGEEGKWTLIEYNGTEAYVFSEYLTEEEPVQ